MIGSDVINITLPKPHRGQLEVLKSKARWKVLMCGRRWGKSLICQIISILSIFKKQDVAYVTPTYKLSKIFFDDILKYIPAITIQSANKSDLKITLKGGGSISFMTGENLDSFRGRKFHKVIIDEAAYIPDLENAWLNAIRPTLTDYRGEALFISTPRGKGYFYSLYLKGVNKEDGFESFHYETSSNPFIHPDEIESAKASLPKAVFDQEYRAVPNANSNAVITSDIIEAQTIQTLSTNPVQAIGIDLAKYSDYTVISSLDQYGTMCGFDRFQKSHEDTINTILKLPRNVIKVIDATGAGDVIYEQLIQRGCQNLIPFVFTAQSKPELIQQMILAVEQGRLKFNQLTADEFGIYEWQYTRTGHITFGNKSGGNDDAVTALALANRALSYSAVNSNIMKSFGFG